MSRACEMQSECASSRAATPSAARSRREARVGPLALAIRAVERGLVPDAITRWGIRRLCRQGLRARTNNPGAAAQRAQEFVEILSSSPIAIETSAANEQHYEVPAAFFELVLGTHRKYSGCTWSPDVTSLDEAEATALDEICDRAEIRNGLDILELGCGWGSLSLWTARRYPNARITAVSNSLSQRRYIEQRRDERGLSNLRVITADVNRFEPQSTFDRVVSVEMFEHMRNYHVLMSRIASWLRRDGKLFVHIFAHARTPYLFEDRGPADWMSRHFFTGGIMPSHDLLLCFQRDLVLEQRWRIRGSHYERTANAWLANLDANRTRVGEIMRDAYGSRDWRVWLNRWRVFFISCAEMFGYAGGREWGVSHYRFIKRSS